MNRVIPGVLMAGTWLLLLFWGPTAFFSVVIALAACLALQEFFRMALPDLTGGRLYASIATCLLPVLLASSGRSDLILAGSILSLLGTAGIALQGYTVLPDVFRYLCASGFANIYIALCMAHVVLLRLQPQGAFWLLLLMVIVAGSDTGAYYAGRAWGHRKLFPAISPKKTVAGSVGGLVAGVVAAEGVALLFPGAADPVRLFFVALLLIVIGIAGDLTESMLKRAVGVKDSGTILFGHGGLLDRIDSLLLTAPVLYYLVAFGWAA